MNIVANPVCVVGFDAVGISVSVPWPSLFFWTKFKTVNDWAAPTVGTNVPSSWRKIPSVKDGSKDTQRIPFPSRLRKFAFEPDDPAESKIFLAILILPSKSALKGPYTTSLLLNPAKLPGSSVPTPKVPKPVNESASVPTPIWNLWLGNVVPIPVFASSVMIKTDWNGSIGNLGSKIIYRDIEKEKKKRVAKKQKKLDYISEKLTT